MMLKEHERNDEVMIQRQPDHGDFEAGAVRCSGRRLVPGPWHESRFVPLAIKQEWPMDFMNGALMDGREFRTFNVIDYACFRVTRACQSTTDSMAMAVQQCTNHFYPILTECQPCLSITISELAAWHSNPDYARTIKSAIKKSFE